MITIGGMMVEMCVNFLTMEKLPQRNIYAIKRMVKQAHQLYGARGVSQLVRIAHSIAHMEKEIQKGRVVKLSEIAGVDYGTHKGTTGGTSTISFTD